MSATRLLPDEFSDLERYAPTWAVHSGHERMQRRLHATMEELQAFYDDAFPRAEAAMEYLDQFDLKEMPEEAQYLMWLLYSLSVVSLAVDVFKQPKVPDSGATYLEWVTEPIP